VRTEAPFTVSWASICAGVQYMPANGGLDTSWPLIRTSSARSRADLPGSARYGSGGGSCGCGSVHAADNASSGTIHGEIEVANDLPPNGPSGTDSQAWMSREDQSLTRNTPKTCSAKPDTRTGVPSWDPVPMTKPTSASKSIRRDGPNVGAVSDCALRCPLGQRTWVPDTTTVPDRPWYPIGMCFQLGVSGRAPGRKIFPTLLAWCSLA
jgi:hypothetical protein